MLDMGREKPVSKAEIVELRSASSKVFLRDDGKREYHIWSAPVHYLDRDTGRLEDISFDVLPDDRVDGFTHNLRQMPYRLRLGQSVWRMGFGVGQYITLKPLKCSRVTPLIDGRQITYKDLWPSVDLRLSLLSCGIKEDIILKDSSAPVTLTFDISDRAGIQIRADGQKWLIIDEKNTPLGMIPRLTAHDAKGREFTVNTEWSDSSLKVELKEAALEAAFPVTIDPTYVIQPGDDEAEDAYVTEFAKDQNYGSDLFFYAGTDPNNRKHRSFIRFPLSSIPLSEFVTGAIMQLHCDSQSSETAYNVGCYRVTEEWDESAITWNNQPEYEPTATDTKSVVMGQRPQWNITSLVHAWHEGQSPNFGVALINHSEATLSSRKRFSSSAAAVELDRPKLTVTTAVKPTVNLTSMNGTVLAPATSSDDVTPTLSGRYAHPNGRSMTHRQHMVCDAVGNTIWDSGKVAQAADPDDIVNVIVPYGCLAYGRLYQWKWRAWDQQDVSSDWSAAGWFTCKLTQSPVPTDLAAGKRLYAQTRSGRVVCLEETTKDLGSDTAWQAVYVMPMTSEFDDLMVTLHLRRVWLKVHLPEGSSMDVQYSVRLEDLGDDEDWLTAHSLVAGTGIQVVDIQAPFASGETYEGHQFRLKLSGKGPHKTLKLGFEYEEADV
jgi:hypothetical protein